MLLLPMGGLGVRVLTGVLLAAAIDALSPPLLTLRWFEVVGEAGIGAFMGVLVGLPIHLGRGLAPRGPQTLALSGQVWSLAVFFALGGPLLLLVGLSSSLDSVALSADAIAVSGTGFLSGLLLIGLPFWLVDLSVAPIAGLLGRLGDAEGARGLLLARALLGVGAAAMAVPFVLDLLRGYWIEALRTLGGGG